MKNAIQNPSESQIQVFQKCSVRLSPSETYNGTILEVGVKTMMPGHTIRVEISDYIPTLKRHHTFNKACSPSQILTVWDE